MTPKLIVIAGPSEGMTFVIAEAEVSVGRELDNQICLPDLSVSRRHFSIKQSGQEFQLLDHGSLNATVVNGMPVKQHALKSGDRIRVGDSTLLFLREAEQPRDTSDLVQFDDARLITRNTVLLRKDDAVNFEPHSSSPNSAPLTRSARDLNALLKISLAINSFSRPEAMLEHLLQLIGTVIPADCGAILLAQRHVEAEDGSEEFAPVCGWRRERESAEPIKVSRTVTERARAEGVAILSNDVERDFDLTSARSLAFQGVSALLAAPLIISDKVQGVIYLDSSAPSVEFDQDHLQLLRAIAELAAAALENLRRVNRLEDENQRLRAEISIEHDMIGNSPRMREVYQFIGKVAGADSTVLIRGESGTGKELAARAIHLNSQRATKPFVAINCAALTETLLESELFGHEKGAFTGATSLKKGKLEAAQGGTVFLDELGEMALTLQSKLLRVLQEHEFERVGGVRTIKSDIRLIAATNRNLEQAIKDGRFREDLYYRLNVICLNLPPLRERREDITALAHYFAAKYSQRCKRKITGISPEAMSCLMNYDWPGNVREFENAIERAVVLGSSEIIKVEDLPEAVIEASPSKTSSAGASAPQDFYQAVNEAKKRLIVDAFDRAQGSYTEAAKLLGMHPNHLHRLIRNLNMKADLKK
ncbi:MAG: Anaerobic nitric oxide reductase transcription regulator NorR [Acidobacteria bacterium]|nr:Anaerobic nitric oxide reductase transcription regulator NorR [Acidobacteriota bacterium]